MALGVEIQTSLWIFKKKLGEVKLDNLKNLGFTTPKYKQISEYPAIQKSSKVSIYFISIQSMTKLKFDSKGNQMRSLDLDFRQKNRIFDLDRLRAIESKKNWSKSWRTNQNLKLYRVSHCKLEKVIWLWEKEGERYFWYSMALFFKKPYAHFDIWACFY